MKKLKYITYLVGVLAISAVIFTSCKDDFLERPPQDAIIDINFYKSNDQVLAASQTLYSTVWFDYNDKASYNLGDFRGGTTYSGYNDLDNVKFSTTGATPENGAAWRAFFIVISQSNQFMENLQKYGGPQVSEKIRKITTAEARFMRALAYRYLVMNWGEVPIITSNTKLLDNPKVKKSTVKSIWRFITNEMRAALEDLPDNPIQQGRATKMAAEAMLARFYLTRAGVESTGLIRKQEYLDSAKYFSQRVISSKKYEMLPSYENLFKVPYDFNSESIFSLLWQVTDVNGYGTANSTPAYLAFDPSIGNTDGKQTDGWGGDKGATLWMLQQYEGLVSNGKTPDKRLKATYMLPGFSYPEVLQDKGDKLEPLTFPYAGGDVNYVSIKKYVAGKATAANPAFKQQYNYDTYMMRSAELYLIYAEAVLGNQSSTNDATALAYVNKIRERAGLAPISDSNGNPRDLTWDDIFKERIIEFAMEGMAWYDLVNLHYYNPEKAYSIISSQDRERFGVQVDKFPNPTIYTFVPTPWVNTQRTFTADAGNFLLPIPDAELTQAPYLREAGEDYYEGK